MSELNARIIQNGFRWQLLTTVSAMTLLACVSPGRADTADGASESPPVWIELGGEFAQSKTDQEIFRPPFLSHSPFSGASEANQQKPPLSSWDGTAKIVFEPSGTDWMFSASVLYGENNKHDRQNQLTAHATTGLGYNFNYAAYQNAVVQHGQSHFILDFQAGKDVGLGKFGSGGSSLLGVGIRYAQFTTRNNIGIRSQPTNTVVTYNRFYASFAAKRKFNGIGPSLSWDASADLIGRPSTGDITFDWGLNGAVLFGRQRVQGHHETSKIYIPHATSISFDHTHIHPHIPRYHYSTPLNRNRSVAVPNLGGFAGVSWRYPNAKVSLGYRADFFFGAMDGGIDAAHRENVGFYGPFASVSVGIGG